MQGWGGRREGKQLSPAATSSLALHYPYSELAVTVAGLKPLREGNTVNGRKRRKRWDVGNAGWSLLEA